MDRWKYPWQLTDPGAGFPAHSIGGTMFAVNSLARAHGHRRGGYRAGRHAAQKAFHENGVTK
jgi:hypothetical protein